MQLLTQLIRVIWEIMILSSQGHLIMRQAYTWHLAHVSESSGPVCCLIYATGKHWALFPCRICLQDMLKCKWVIDWMENIWGRKSDPITDRQIWLKAVVHEPELKPPQRDCSKNNKIRNKEINLLLLVVLFRNDIPHFYRLAHNFGIDSNISTTI